MLLIVSFAVLLKSKDQPYILLKREIKLGGHNRLCSYTQGPSGVGGQVNSSTQTTRCTPGPALSSSQRSVSHTGDPLDRSGKSKLSRLCSALIQIRLIVSNNILEDEGQKKQPFNFSVTHRKW